MKKVKDNFSLNAHLYKKYRPLYPIEFIEAIVSLVETKEKCWDCATGNGQVAGILSPYFEKVFASDVSHNQIAEAKKWGNIEYRVERSEKTAYPDSFFDLITVGQAIHWFDFDMFYKEANRVLKPNGILAVFGYGLVKGSEKFNEYIKEFYWHEVGSYWDKERGYLDEEYKTIPFTYKEMSLPKKYKIEVRWTIDELEGYLKSWSAVKHYTAANKIDPVEGFIKKLSKAFPPGHEFYLNFPVFYKIGRK